MNRIDSNIAAHSFIASTVANWISGSAKNQNPTGRKELSVREAIADAASSASERYYSNAQDPATLVQNTELIITGRENGFDERPQLYGTSPAPCVATRFRLAANLIQNSQSPLERLMALERVQAFAPEFTLTGDYPITTMIENIQAVVNQQEQQ